MSAATGGWREKERVVGFNGLAGGATGDKGFAAARETCVVVEVDGAGGEDALGIGEEAIDEHGSAPGGAAQMDELGCRRAARVCGMDEDGEALRKRWRKDFIKEDGLGRVGSGGDEE